jgi:hypothetical protein
MSAGGVKGLIGQIKPSAQHALPVLSGWGLLWIKVERPRQWQAAQKNQKGRPRGGPSLLPSGIREQD